MSEKIRINITVDKSSLEKAKKKLHLFGGKLSTLFNAYLQDFIEGMEKQEKGFRGSEIKIKELEERIQKLESLTKSR